MGPAVLKNVIIRKGYQKCVLSIVQTFDPYGKKVKNVLLHTYVFKVNEKNYDCWKANSLYFSKHDKSDIDNSSYLYFIILLLTLLQMFNTLN